LIQTVGSVRKALLPRGECGFSQDSLSDIRMQFPQSNFHRAIIRSIRVYLHLTSHFPAAFIVILVDNENSLWVARTTMCIELMGRPTKLAHVQARLILRRDDLHRGDSYFAAEHESESTTAKRYHSKFVRHPLMVVIATHNDSKG
jgi:hypothetical protein